MSGDAAPPPPPRDVPAAEASDDAAEDAGSGARTPPEAEAPEPRPTGSMKKRARRAEAKEARKGMKSLMGEVKARRAAEATATRRDAGHPSGPAAERPAAASASASASSSRTRSNASASSSSSSPSSSAAANPPGADDAPPGAATDPTSPPTPVGIAPLRAYATAPQNAASKTLLAAADVAWTERRVEDAARLYEGAAAENGAGYAQLMALRAHEGDLLGALDAYRSAAATARGAGGGEAARARPDRVTRAMAAALAELVVVGAKAAAERRAAEDLERRVPEGGSPGGEEHSSEDEDERVSDEDVAGPRGTRLRRGGRTPPRLTFPTPAGWSSEAFDTLAEFLSRDVAARHKKRETLRRNASRRVIAASTPALAAGLVLRAHADASRGVAAAAEAIRVAAPGVLGWRLAVRFAAAAGRAAEHAAPETANAAFRCAAAVAIDGLEALGDPLLVVAESEWALGGAYGAAAENARGEVVAAALERCADRFARAVARLAPAEKAGDDAGDEKGEEETSRADEGEALEALVAFVGCVAETGEGGADASASAAQRVADACWALRAKRAHEDAVASARDGGLGLDDRAIAERLERASVELAACAAPRNAFGWAPDRVVARCLASCLALPAPSAALAAAMARLVERSPDAGAALRAPIATLAERARKSAADRREGEEGTEPARAEEDESSSASAEDSGSNVLTAAETARAAFVSAVAGSVRALAVDGSRGAARSAASCPAAVLAEATLRTAGRAAKDLLEPGAELPPPQSAPAWWVGNSAAAVADPLDLGARDDPLARLLGVAPDATLPRPNPRRTTVEEVAARSKAEPNIETGAAKANITGSNRRKVDEGKGKEKETGTDADAVPLAPFPAGPVEAAAASIEADVAALRASLANARRVDEAAAKAAVDAARRKAERVEAEAAAREAEAEEEEEVSAVMDASVSDAGVSDAGVTDASARVGEWSLVLPDELGAGLDGTRLSDATEDGSNAGASSSGSLASDLTPEEDLLRESPPPKEDAGEDDDDELRAEDAELRKRKDCRAAKRKKREEARRFESSDERTKPASASPGETRENRRALRAERRDAAARTAVALAANLGDLKTLARGEPSRGRRLDLGVDPLPRTATAGRSRRNPGAATGSGSGDDSVAKRSVAEERTGASSAGFVARLTPLMTAFDASRSTLRSSRSGGITNGSLATHVRLLTREALREAASRAASDAVGRVGREMDAGIVRGASGFAETAKAVAAAAVEATAESERRLAEALAEASPERLLKIEAAIRAARGERSEEDGGVEESASARDASGRLAEKENLLGGSLNVRASIQAKHSAHLAASLDAEQNAAFTVEAALRRFDLAPSSPLDVDSVASAAEEAARESAKLGPSAREMYYASYKAAMDHAIAAVRRDDAAAVMAAAAGAARAARAETAGGARKVMGFGSVVPPLWEDDATAARDPERAVFLREKSSSRRRVAAALRRRRDAASASASRRVAEAAEAVDAREGPRIDPAARARVLAAVAEAERSTEFLAGEIGAESRRAYEAARNRTTGGFGDPDPKRGDEDPAEPKRTPGAERARVPSLARPAMVPSLKIKGTSADLSLRFEDAPPGSTAPPLAPRAGGEPEEDLAPPLAPRPSLGAKLRDANPDDRRVGAEVLREERARARALASDDSDSESDDSDDDADADAGDLRGTHAPLEDHPTTPLPTAPSPGPVAGSPSGVLRSTRRTRVPPPDPFPALLAWTQKQGGRALATLWAAVARAPRAGGPLRPAQSSGPVLDRAELRAFVTRELLLAEDAGAESLAFLDAVLSADFGEEVSLPEFIRGVRDGARATSAAAAGFEAAIRGASVALGTPTSGARRGGGRGGGRGALTNEASIRRAAERVDAAVGTLKRRFKKAPGEALTPAELVAALADASVEPADVRATLAELREWEGFPLRVKFQKLVATLRPRAARAAERARSETGAATDEDGGDAGGEEREERDAREERDTREERDAREERARGTSPAHGGIVSPSSFDTPPAAPRFGAPSRFGPLPPSSPAALEREIEIEIAAERARALADAARERERAAREAERAAAEAAAALEGDAAAARAAALLSAEKASVRFERNDQTGIDERPTSSPAARPDPTRALEFATAAVPFSPEASFFTSPVTGATPLARFASVGARGGVSFSPSPPGSGSSASKLQRARERRAAANAPSPFSADAERFAATARAELEAALRLDEASLAAGGDVTSSLGPFSTAVSSGVGVTATERATMFAGLSDAAAAHFVGARGVRERAAVRRAADVPSPSTKPFDPSAYVPSTARGARAAERLRVVTSAEALRRGAEAERLRRDAADEVMRGFEDLKTTLRALEADANELETDLEASAATMAAIDDARRRAAEARVANLAESAKRRRERAEDEERGADDARALIEQSRKRKPEGVIS